MYCSLLLVYCTVQYSTVQYTKSKLQYITVKFGPFSTNILRYTYSTSLYTIQYSTVQYSTVQYNTIQYNTIQYNTIQCKTIQYNKMLYSTVEHNTAVRHCLVLSFAALCSSGECAVILYCTALSC